MAQLNFPQDRTELTPPGTGPLETGDTYTANGTTWVYNADAGAWGSGGGETSSDIFLSRVNDDTAEGAITFEKLTTHKAGVDVVNAVINNDGSATFAGNVGIGTTSPDYLLYIDAGTGLTSLRISGQSSGSGRIFTAGHNASGQAEISAGSSAGVDNTLNIFGRPTIFGRNAVNEYARIDSSGNFLIGGTLPDNPNISLDASGSAEFAGAVVVGDLDTSSASGKGARVRYTPSGSNGNFGNFLAQCDGASPRPELIPAIYAYNGTNQVAAINFDGSATFEGCVRGKASVNTDAAFRGYYSDGEIGVALARQMSSPSGQMQTLLYDTSGSANITLTHQDGSASFAGGIECLDVFANRPSAGNFAYGTGLDGSRTSAWLADSTLKLGTNSVGSGEKISLNADGSGTFAGDVQVGGDPAGGANAGCDVRANGSLVIAGNSSGDSAITIYDAGNSSGKISLNADGSAEFAGGEIQLKSTGQVYSNRTVGNGACFYGNLNGSNTSAIFADGSAEFAGGEVTIFSSGSLRTNGQIYVSDKTTLSSDGSATFAGLTEHAGGVKVTGGTAGTGSIISNSNNLVFYGSNSDQPAFTAGLSSSTIRYGITSSGVNNDTKNVAFQIYNVQPVTAPATYQNIYSVSLNGLPGPIANFKAFNVDGGQRDNLNATNNYAFFSNINTSTNPGSSAYNFYASGTAPNYFAGKVAVGNIPDDNPANDTTGQGISLRPDGFISALRVNDQALSIGRRGTTGNLVTFFHDGKNVGNIATDGANISVNGQASDYRIKTNIQTLPSAVNLIKTIRPVTFEYTDRNVGQTYRGFIAHELQEAGVTEAVFGSKDATEAIGTLADYDGTVLETEVTEPSAEELTYTEEVEATPYVDAVAATYDEYGTELTAEVPAVEPTYTTVTRTRTWTPSGTRPVYQGVDQTKLIPLLTKALQEVLTKNEDLEARIAALEGA